MKKLFYTFLLLFLWLGTGTNRLSAKPPFTVIAPAQNALHFDGANDLVSCGTSSTNLTGNLTIEFWLYNSGAMDGATVISKSYLSEFEITFWGNELNFYQGKSGGTFESFTTGATVTAATPSWNHFAVVRNATAKTIATYKNGVKISTVSYTSTLISSANALTLGSRPGGGLNMHGSLDEVRIWHAVRTDAEVANHYSCQLVGNETNLLTYYKFDQGIAAGSNTSVTSLTDATSSARTGTLTNFALTGATSNWVAGNSSISASVTPSVSIAASPSGAITAGTSVTFTATATHGGTTPTYVWKKGGVAISGQTAATYTSTTLANGDVITCDMTSNASCTTTATATSTGITMTVNAAAAPNALHFDGVNDLVSCGTSSTNLTGNLTIEFWLYNSGAMDGATVISKSYLGEFEITFWGNELNFYQGKSGGTFESFTTGATVTAATPSWNHFAVVRNATAKTIATYKNGVKISTVSYTSTLISSANALTLGSRPGGGLNMHGSLDEVRIWHATRTDAEIANHYSCQLVGNETNLLTYYKFDQGTAAGTNTSVTTLTDATSNARTGTLTNFALTGATSNWITSTATTTVTPSVSIAASPSGMINAGTSVTFTATATHGGATPTYVWKKGGVAISGQTAATYTSTTLANGDVITCDMTSNAACASPTTATSTGITMTVNSATVTPSVSIAITSGSQTTCANSSVIFTATPTHGGTAPSYQWKKNGVNTGLSGTGANNYAASSWANNDVITCVMTSNDANASPTTATSSGITLTVTAPTPVITGATTGCGSVTLTASGGTNYIWSSGQNSADGATFTTSGTYTVTVTNSVTGCSATASAVVTVNAPPTINAVANQTVCAGSHTAAITFAGTGATSYTWTNNNTATGLAASGTGNIAAFATTNSTGSAITSTVTVTPTSSSAGYAYIPNYGSNNVSVINTSSNTVVATVAVGTLPAGVSVSPDGSRVYVANDGTNNVSVINTSTNTVVATVAVGTSPHGVSVSPDGSRVYVANYLSHNVSVINTSTNTVVATVSVGTRPEGVSISPDGSHVYVANGSSDNVSVINTSTNTVVATVAVGSSPQGVSVSPDGSRVYVANTFSNNVSVINTSTNTVVATVAVGTNPQGVSVSLDGSRVYVTNSVPNNVSVINTSTNTVVATVGVGTSPYGVSVSPDGSRVYVANTFSNNVSVINTSTNAVVATVAVGSSPVSVGNFIKAGSAGCTGTPTTFTLTVNPAVTPSVSIAASPSGAITAGTSVTFTATATHGGTTPTYVWKKGGVAISGQTAATYTTTTLSNGDVITCDMTSNAVCASPTTATSASITMTVGAAAPNALHFDGVNDLVDCGNAANLQLSTGTIEAWIKTSGAGAGFRGIVVKQYAYGLFLNSNVLVAYDWTTSSVKSTGVNLADGQWHHVAFVFQPTANLSKIYIDGVPRLTIASAWGIAYQTVPLKIGDGDVAVPYAQCFNGNIDGVRVWNTARTDAQIASDYSCQLTGSESGLVACYNFNQGVAAGTNTGLTTLADATVHANNGTLTNFALTGATSNWVTNDYRTVLVPSVSIAASPSGAITTGTSVTFTATPTHSGSAPTYVWKKGGVAISGQTAATYTSNTLANDDVITCVVTSSLPCASPTTATSTGITMTVNSATVTPSVSIAITSGSQTTCANSSVIFTATPIHGGTAPSYQWKKNGVNTGLSGTGANNYAASSWANNDVITCVMTSNDANASPTTATSSGITLTVTAPTPVITGATTGCGSVTLTASGGTNYSWSSGQNSADGATFTTSGTYTVTVTNSVTGCSATASAVVTVHSTCSYTWTGATSTDWATATNWNPNGIPTSTDNIIIPTTTNKPMLPANQTIANMNLTGTNKVILGNNTLCVNAITGGSSSSYVVTNGTGSLIIKALPTNAATTFPIGASETSYDPLSIRPTNSVDFTAKVKATTVAGDFTGTIVNFAKTAKRQWDITPSASAGSTVLTLTNGGTAYTVVGTPKVGHYNGTVWSELAATHNNGTWTATTSSFSPFGVGEAGGFVTVLPVELLTFTGYNKGGVNILNWATANEVNNKGFQVERLNAQGNVWDILGFKTANNKASFYDFTDNTPLRTSYYRLRQLDNDGKETYSKVISVSLKGSDKLKVYPNPVSNILTVETDREGDFQILNLLGQQVLNGKAAQRIDVSALPQGAYFLKVDTEQVKFIKD